MAKTATAHGENWRRMLHVADIYSILDWNSKINLCFVSLFEIRFCDHTLLVAQMIKNLPAVWETWIWTLGPEDPLEKGMATHSRVLAWKIPSTEEPGGLQSMGLQRVRHDWATNVPWSMPLRSYLQFIWRDGWPHPSFLGKLSSRRGAGIKIWVAGPLVWFWCK